MSFQINTGDPLRSTVFLKFGEVIPATTLKIVKFELKLQEEGAADVSVLTAMDTKTNQVRTLMLGQVVNSKPAEKPEL